MTLRELSAGYRAAAEPIRQRLRQIRQQEKIARAPEERFWLQRRRVALAQALAELNDLAELTERYYERGFYRDEKDRL